jgi:hypothetical protein
LVEVDLVDLEHHLDQLVVMEQVVIHQFFQQLHPQQVVVEVEVIVHLQTLGLTGGSKVEVVEVTLVSPAGTGNTPPTSPSQGNNGGTGSPVGQNTGGGGGGGAGAGRNSRNSRKCWRSRRNRITNSNNIFWSNGLQVMELQVQLEEDILQVEVEVEVFLIQGCRRGWRWWWSKRIS